MSIPSALRALQICGGDAHAAVQQELARVPVDTLAIRHAVVEFCRARGMSAGIMASKPASPERSALTGSPPGMQTHAGAHSGSGVVATSGGPSLAAAAAAQQPAQAEAAGAPYEAISQGTPNNSAGNAVAATCAQSVSNAAAATPCRQQHSAEEAQPSTPAGAKRPRGEKAQALSEAAQAKLEFHAWLDQLCSLVRPTLSTLPVVNGCGASCV